MGKISCRGKRTAVMLKRPVICDPDREKVVKKPATTKIVVAEKSGVQGSSKWVPEQVVDSKGTRNCRNNPFGKECDERPVAQVGCS